MNFSIDRKQIDSLWLTTRGRSTLTRTEFKDIVEEEADRHRPGVSDSAASHDREYHGERFYTAEW